MRTSLALLALASCFGCAGELNSRAPSRAVDSANARSPIVGRLRMRGGTIDLTASSFARGDNRVPREALASEVLADVDARTTGRRELRSSDR
jgi:hypothetical protein